MDAVRARIRDVPDFPRPGIVFKDITPVLADAELFRRVIDAFVEIPEDAEPGVYAYEVAFSGKGLSFDKSLTFLVKGD